MMTPARNVAFRRRAIFLLVNAAIVLPVVVKSENLVPEWVRESSMKFSSTQAPEIRFWSK